MSALLAGRVAVVTGASSGIGEATGRALVAEGARVAVLARRGARLERLADELGRDRCFVQPLDVTDAAETRGAAARIAEALGRVDCLVNNAGVMYLSPFERDRREDWRAMVEVNLLSVLELTAAFLPQLREGGGDIVNISSVAGRKARPNSSVYSATKWGMNGWSEALRQELLPYDVRVVVIEPGAVHTELVENIREDDVRERSASFYDSVGALHSEDVAAAVVYALSQPRRVSVNELLIRPTRQEY